MQIIPVIDLMDGVVVHAKRGNRDNYRPMQTPLCSGSSPHAILDGLLKLHGFDTLYVADLDALRGKSCQQELLDRLQLDYPSIRFWIDRGLPPIGLQEPAFNGIAVIGSESLDENSLGYLQSLGGEFILSLDFKEERLLGPECLLEDSGVWPEKIIIMSLSHVGSCEGPDFQRMEKYRAQWPEKQIIAAGGIRNEDDLKRLDGMGISGVMLASALHSGALGATVLRNYS